MQKTIHSRLSAVLGRYFVGIRNKAGLTQREMAKRLGKAYSFIDKIERGARRVDLAEFFQICRIMGLNPSKEASELMKLMAKK